MRNGYLSQYFEAIAVKRLSAVEVTPAKSHQHEFNGSKELKAVIRSDERKQFTTKFLWIEEQNEGLSDDGVMTWYDARENHPSRSEFRLYFPDNMVMSMAREGDTMFIAKRTDGTLLVILTSPESTMESQLYWLFGLPCPSYQKFEYSEIEKNKDTKIDFTIRFILDEIGVEVEEPDNDFLDNLLLPFNGKFPVTRDFSKYARETNPSEFDPIEDPDGALICLMEWEEKLFRRLERHVVAEKMKDGFISNNGEQDVDGFISFSLSVQNRRKSRAGYAFEDHVSFLFQKNQILFSARSETENKTKPDFIFPGILSYRNSLFPSSLLTMLGVKTTCKDRWRQVLAEAKRIKEIKHLMTLEPGISENQTNEMKANNLQLVLPESIHSSYKDEQQAWLMNIREFIALVADKQKKARETGFL